MERFPEVPAILSVTVVLTLQNAKYEAMPFMVIQIYEGSPSGQLLGLSVLNVSVRDAIMHMPSARNGMSRMTTRQNQDTHIL
jgi:hypothetical protein